MRAFSSAAINSCVQTQFFTDSARVQLRLPTKGETWFFVQPDTTIGDFVQQVRDEDTLVSSISFSRSQGAVGEADNLYILLAEQKATAIKINNISYDFEGALKNGLDVSYKTDGYYQKCLDMGLSPLNASTVS